MGGGRLSTRRRATPPVVDLDDPSDDNTLSPTPDTTVAASTPTGVLAASLPVPISEDQREPSAPRPSNATTRESTGDHDCPHDDDNEETAGRSRAASVKDGDWDEETDEDLDDDDADFVDDDDSDGEFTADVGPKPRAPTTTNKKTAPARNKTVQRDAGNVASKAKSKGTARTGSKVVKREPVRTGNARASARPRTAMKAGIQFPSGVAVGGVRAGLSKRSRVKSLHPNLGASTVSH